MMPKWLDHVKTRSSVFDGDNVSHQAPAPHPMYVQR